MQLVIYMHDKNKFYMSIFEFENILLKYHAEKAFLLVILNLIDFSLKRCIGSDGISCYIQIQLYNRVLLGKESSAIA